MTADPPAIHTEGLSKDYGAGRGLFDLDLDVRAGEVFGWLGPNGAGKTTTIRLLMGMIHPTAGNAAVFGIDCIRNAVDVARHVGYVPGELPQFGGLRGSDVAAYLGAMRGGVDRNHVAALAKRLDLDLGRRFREYSRGNKQKLALLLAFMARPRLYILDEPTGGLDPLNQQTFYEMVREVSEAGATVFLSSHVLSEVEHICTRVGIIRDGRLVDDRSLSELHTMRYHDVEVVFDGPVPGDGVLRAAGVDNVRVEGSRLTCTVHGDFSPFLAALRDAHVVNLVSTEPTLESVFLTYYRDAVPDRQSAGRDSP